MAGHARDEHLFQIVHQTNRPKASARHKQNIKWLSSSMSLILSKMLIEISSKLRFQTVSSVNLAMLSFIIDL